MISFRLVLCAAALIAVSAGSLQARGSVEKLHLSDAQVSAAEDQIAAHLLDPWSAEFFGFNASSEGGKSGYACGLVNSKNVHGGYVGWKPYFVMINDIESMSLHTPMLSDDYDPRSIARMCESRGLHLRRPSLIGG